MVGSIRLRREISHWDAVCPVLQWGHSVAQSDDLIFVGCEIQCILPVQEGSSSWSSGAFFNRYIDAFQFLEENKKSGIECNDIVSQLIDVAIFGQL